MEKFPEGQTNKTEEKTDVELTPEQIEEIDQEIEAERDQVYEEFCETEFSAEEDQRWTDAINEAGAAKDRQAALKHLREYHEHLRKTYPKL
jgi:hypothetical protein